MGFTLEAMRRPLEALGYEVVVELAGVQVFDRGTIRAQPELLTRAASLGADLAAAVLP